MLQKAIAGKQFEYPIAVDIEENSLRPLSADALTGLVIRAVKAIESLGYYAMVYTYTNYRQTELNMKRLADYDLWIADYRGSRPTIKHGIWQYSSRGRVDGVTGYVDCNYAYKDYPAMIAAAGLNGMTAQPPAQPPAPGKAKRYLPTVSPCSYGDAAVLYAVLAEAAGKLGNITVTMQEVT